MEEYFKQNLVKPRMMMGVLNIVTHNSSYKGHKPLVETNLPLPPPCRQHRDRMIVGFICNIYVRYFFYIENYMFYSL
jgi:hypothetical protein